VRRQICRHPAITSREIAGAQMGLVVASLATMGMGQILLASVFLASYALALGDFAGALGRPIAIVTAIFAAVGFVVLNHPWEAGVILLALAPVGMGLFAGAAWTLCKVTAGSTRSVAVVPSATPLPTSSRAASVSLLERVRARLRFT
jgi:hypothetical protein